MEIRFANTAQGRRVPILDYRLGEFRHRAPGAIQQLGSLAVLRALKWMPPAGRRWLGTRSEVLKNLLLRGNEEGGFFSGPATYLAKLGPKAPHASRLDRLAAGSVQSIESARRGYAIARLERDVLAFFAKTAASPLHVLNIGGGPASDNLNALLLWKAEQAESQSAYFARGGSVAIRVLDGDSDGVTLGQNCLSVLQQAGAPLGGQPVTLEWTPYNWEQPQTFAALLSQARGPVLLTAEGSLFEYASDEIVTAHLAHLAAYRGGPVAVVGSVFREKSEISLVARRMLGLSPHLGWQLRGLEGLQKLAAKSGWAVTASDTENSIYEMFTLTQLR